MISVESAGEAVEGGVPVSSRKDLAILIKRDINVREGWDVSY
jgi:hypothetical protein